MNDEIIDEVRRIRVELASEANFDLREIARRAAKAASQHRHRLAMPREEVSATTPRGDAPVAPVGAQP
ncbi:MAG: hypothetical protein IV100_28655 [Myxococcales bacterium]|nr:hypothetical protein [Myxococcales bacterium]